MTLLERWTGRPGTPIVWDPAINKVLKILDGGVNDLLSLLLPECELPIICIMYWCWCITGELNPVFNHFVWEQLLFH